MKDPFGAILTIIRDDPAVSGIVADRVSDLVEETPSVKLIDNASSLLPFGADSGRIGVQYWQAIARCYGNDDATGAIGARQLAGAVADAVHGHGSIQVGTTLVYRMSVPEIAGALRDPETNWPYYDVRINAYASTEAVS